MIWDISLDLFCLDILDSFKLVNDLSLQILAWFFLAIRTFYFLTTSWLSSLALLEVC